MSSAIPSAVRQRTFLHRFSGGPVSSWTLALRVLARHRAMALAQCTAMAVAIAVPLSLQLVGSSAAQTGYQSLLSASSGSSVVTIELPGIANQSSYADFQQGTDRLVNSEIGADLQVLTTYTRAGSFSVYMLNGKPWSGASGLTAASYPDLRTHVSLVSGFFRDGKGLETPIPVEMSQSAATEAGLATGDVVCLGISVAERTWCVRLVGTWQALHPNDPYWQAGPGSADLTLSTADYFQFLSAAQAAGGGDVRFRAGRVYQPDPAHFTVAGAPAFVNGLTRLRGQVEIQQGGSFVTSLDHTVQTFLDRSRVNAFPVQLVGASLLLIVLYALALLSQNYLDSQRQQSLLWRTRGWRRERLANFFVLQVGILLVPSVILGTALALFATWILLGVETGFSSPVNVGWGTVSLAGLLGGVAVVVLLEAGLAIRFSRRSIVEMRRELARPSPVPWWRWRNVDLVLALLAIPLLGEAQLRSQVAVRGTSSGEDLVGLVMPVAAIAVLGLATLRLLPLAARACVLAPKNLAARLSGLRMSRQPSEHAGLALLLTLAVAIGAFASVYSATERQNLLDRVAYRVGADIRVRYNDQAPPDAIKSDLAKLQHVNSSTQVLRQTVHLGNSATDITALGVEPQSFVATAWSRNGLSTQPLDTAFRAFASRTVQGVPVLMSRATMSKLGIRTGFDTYFYIGSRGFRATVVGPLDYVPTLYPGADDFIVMPLAQALSVASDNQSLSVAPNELWLNVSGDHRPVVASLQRDPNVAFIDDRAAEQATALGDPLFLELEANLAIGFTAALALAALAFAVHFLVATRTRLAENAILEANGLEPSVLRTGIAIEQGLVLLFALAVGAALALTLIIWLLPPLQLGSAALDLVPPTELHADWIALGLGALVTVSVVVVLGWAVRRAASAVNTIEELRRLG